MTSEQSTCPRTVTAFTIKRSEWLRGEGTFASKLLRKADGKRCCVGIYARALGIDDASIAGQSWPIHASHRGMFAPEVWCASDTEAEWLLRHEFGVNTSLAELNDDELLDASAREAAIAAKFAQHGITVTFED